MADTVGDRRQRMSPGRKAMRTEIQALREAGVPQETIAETLSKRFKSPAAQKAALRRLIAKQAGQNARQMAD